MGWAMVCSMIALSLVGLGPGWPFGKCASCLALRLSRPLEARTTRPERPLRGRREESVGIPRANYFEHQLN